MTDESIDSTELHDEAPRLKIFDIRKHPDNRQIPGSVRVDGEMLDEGRDLPFAQDENVVLYCGSGNSCSRIARNLRERGYQARALEGGYRAWVEAGFETEERPAG